MFNRILKILIVITIILIFVAIGALIFLYMSNTFQGSTEYSPETAKRKAGNVKTNILNKKAVDTTKKKEFDTVVFFMDEKNSDLISTALIMRFDKNKKRLSFFSLPKDLTFEIDKELYSELSVGITGIPQIARLSHLYTYSKTKIGLKAGMLMLNNILEMETDKYLMLRPELHKQIFYVNEAGDMTFRAEFKEKLFSGNNIKKLVSEHYNSKYTDFGEEEILKAFKAAKKLKDGIITFKKLPVNETNAGGILNKNEAKRLIRGEKN